MPYLLFGLAIGALADRASRRRLMIACDIARALLLASIPLLAMAGFFALWYCYGVQFIVATLAIGFNAAQVAALPSLVQRDALVAANGRMIAGLSAASIVGPMLAGGLSTLVSMPALLLVDALSFLVSALALVQIRRSFEGAVRPAPARLRQDIADGLRYVWRNPLMRAITLLLLCLNSVGPTARIQLLLFAKLQLGASDAQVGMLWSAAAAGVLLGSLLVARLRRWSVGRVVIGSLLQQGLLLIVFAQMRSYWPALLLWGLFSGVGVLVDINIMALRQAIVPNQLLGRVTTVSRTIGFAAIPLNALLGGALLDQIGDPALVYSAIGALTVVIGLSFVGSPLAHARDERAHNSG
jgi:MFS family permease